MEGDLYATVQDLEERLGRLDDGRFTALLDAASRAVEDFTGRQFNRDDDGTPTATTRRFVPVDPQRLPTDDFHTTTDLAIEVNGTAWAVSDVEPRPWDGFHNGMAGWPFFDLMAVSKSWPFSRTPKVEVTAHWGWASVPEAIKAATLDVAEAGASGSGGVIRAETMGPYSVSYSVPTNGGQVPSELEKAVPYKRKRFGVA